jgi:hypothetical protein
MHLWACLVHGNHGLQHARAAHEARAVWQRGEILSSLVWPTYLLANGGEQLEAFMDGIMYFLVEHQRRDAIRVLSSCLLAQSGHQPLSWASLVLKLRLATSSATVIDGNEKGM